MKANVIVLLAVLFALVFYTSSLQSYHDAKAADPKARQTSQTPKQASSTPKKPIQNPKQTTKGSGKNDPGKPAPQTKQEAQNDSPAKPAPVKLCAFNKIGMVPGNPIHKFKVLSTSTNYENKNFDVTWKEQKIKNHKFFKWISK